MEETGPSDCNWSPGAGGSHQVHPGRATQPRSGPSQQLQNPLGRDSAGEAAWQAGVRLHGGRAPPWDGAWLACSPGRRKEQGGRGGPCRGCGALGMGRQSHVLREGGEGGGFPGDEDTALAEAMIRNH